MRKSERLISAFITGMALSLPAVAQTGAPPMIIDPYEPDICFAEGSDRIDDLAQKEINGAVETHRWLLDHGVSRIIVVGFADAGSSASEGEALARRRAIAIADALAANGAPATAIAVDWKDHSMTAEDARTIPKACNEAAFIVFG